MSADRESTTAETQPKFFWLRIVFDLGLLWSFASAISIPLRIDNWPPAVFLSYPPRAPYILFAFGYAIYLLLTMILSKRTHRGHWLRLGVSLAIIICCTHSLGWNPLRRISTNTDSSKVVLSIVTANTGGHPVEFTDSLKATSQPDIICLQEVSRSHRHKIAANFPNHQWFYGTDDPAHDRNDSLAFTNVTGLRRSTFKTEQAIVTADVTGYRTFAVEAPLQSAPSQSLAIVNVHTTKALAFHAGIQGFLFQTPQKSQQHVDERIAIETWANKQQSNLAILLAGDFNSPTHTVGVRFSHFTNSHLVASNASLLTFPESWPMLGIDHVFGNERINFTKSEVIRNPTSDHRYRRVEFSW